MTILFHLSSFKFYFYSSSSIDDYFLQHWCEHLNPLNYPDFLNTAIELSVLRINYFENYIFKTKLGKVM
jgi:hypothetical protein